MKPSGHLQHLYEWKRSKRRLPEPLWLRHLTRKSLAKEVYRMFGTMITRDIQQTLDAFRQSVDRLFSDVRAGSSPALTGSDYAFTPVIESSLNENELILRAILPGVTEKDVQVTAQNGRLVIEGERQAPQGWGEKAWTSLAYGKFYAEIPVRTGFDLDKVSCRLHDGVLDIQVPVSEAMKPRQIPIESAEGHKALSASA